MMTTPYHSPKPKSSTLTEQQSEKIFQYFQNKDQTLYLINQLEQLWVVKSKWLHCHTSLIKRYSRELGGKELSGSEQGTIGVRTKLNYS
jgi:hypothetical protein